MPINAQPAPNTLLANPSPVPNQVVSTDEAITIAAGQVVITKGSAAAITIDVPPLSMNFQELNIVSNTAFAHVITQPLIGFNGKGSSGTLTFGNAIGNACTLVAYNGQWTVPHTKNVTVA